MWKKLCKLDRMEVIELYETDVKAPIMQKFCILNLEQPTHVRLVAAVGAESCGKEALRRKRMATSKKNQ